MIPIHRLHALSLHRNMIQDPCEACHEAAVPTDAGPPVALASVVVDLPGGPVPLEVTYEVRQSGEEYTCSQWMGSTTYPDLGSTGWSVAMEKRVGALGMIASAVGWWARAGAWVTW